jgi:hypothetical protein
MKLNMFRATHRPSSGGTLSGTVCAWQRPPNTHTKNLPRRKARGCQCSFRLLMIGGVSPEKCWASYKYEIIKFDTLLHLVGFFFMNCTMMHGSTNVMAGNTPQAQPLALALNKFCTALSNHLRGKTFKTFIPFFYHRKTFPPFQYNTGHTGEFATGNVNFCDRPSKTFKEYLQMSDSQSGRNRWSSRSRGKVKCTLVQALRLCTGHTAHRGSRCIALLFHDHGTRRRWGVSFTPRQLFTLGKDPVPTVQKVGWAPGPVWAVVENLATMGTWSPGPSSP